MFDEAALGAENGMTWSLAKKESDGAAAGGGDAQCTAGKDDGSLMKGWDEPGAEDGTSGGSSGPVGACQNLEAEKPTLISGNQSSFSEKTVDKIPYSGYNIQATARVLEW